jgi:hypothetical protein
MPTTVATGMRNPRMHGMPLIWSGLTVIRLNTVTFYLPCHDHRKVATDSLNDNMHPETQTSPNSIQSFAKTLADREIDNIAGTISPSFCYKSWPCFASECSFASFASGEVVYFSRILLCVNNSSR